MSAKLFIHVLMILSDLAIIICGAIIIYSIYYFISRISTKRFLCRYIRRKTKLKKIIEYIVFNSDVNHFYSSDAYAEYVIEYASYIIEHVIQTDSKLKFRKFYNILIINSAITRLLYKVKKYQPLVDFIYEYYEMYFDEFQFEILLRGVYGYGRNNKKSKSKNTTLDETPTDIASHLIDEEIEESGTTDIFQALNDFLD